MNAWSLVRNFCINGLWFFCMTDAVWPWMQNAAWFLQYTMLLLVVVYAGLTWWLLGEAPSADNAADRWREHYWTPVGIASRWITIGWAFFAAAMGWWLVAALRVVIAIMLWIVVNLRQGRVNKEI